MYWHQHRRFLTMIRGALTTAIYRKTMEIDTKDIDGTKTVTLMSTDCERIARGLQFMHELWANIVQIGLATWLIERELGLACIGPIAVTLGTCRSAVDDSSYFSLISPQ